jgi:chromosome segregation ATPase
MDSIETRKVATGMESSGGELDSLEQLRTRADAFFDEMHRAAREIEAAARAKADALIEAKTREASETLEHARRQADELRARVQERLQAIEDLETGLRERSELLQTRLAELVDEFPRLTSFLRGLREMGSEEAGRSSTGEGGTDRDLSESLRAFTQQTAGAHESQLPSGEPPLRR